MLYLLAKYLVLPYAQLSSLRVISYVTVRSILAALTALLICLIFGWPLIRRLHRAGFRDRPREYIWGEEAGKRGTPSAGGVIIFLATLLGALLWNDLRNPFVSWMLFSLLYFFGLGLVDDWLKSRRRSSDLGLPRFAKLAAQVAYGVVLAAVFLSPHSPMAGRLSPSHLYLPFFKSPVIDLSWLYGPFIVFVVVAISNAVNFADGMDGLAIVPAAFCFAVYGIYAYIMGNSRSAAYLLFPFVEGTSELGIFAAAVIGASLGFLWYNSFPAQVFMGDSGSAALGGMLATIAVLTKHEFLFPLVGGIFLAEAFSVLVQDRIAIPLLGRRLFFRAPLHHSFEFRGLSESKVVVRFWIVSFFLALLSLLTIKLR